MAEQPEKKPWDLLTSTEQMVYYDRAQYLVTNGYMSGDIVEIAKQMYEASWRVTQS